MVNIQIRSRLIQNEQTGKSYKCTCQTQFLFHPSRQAACKPAGIDIPLRIHVYEDGGATQVACRMPSEVFAPYGADALMAVGAELDDIFAAILASVEQGA